MHVQWVMWPITIKGHSRIIGWFFHPRLLSGFDASGASSVWELLPSTVFNMWALVNIICIHAGWCTLSISVKPGSATHFSTSTASGGLQHLSVGAHVHLVMLRAVSHHVWLLPHVNISHASQLLVSLGGCQLEPHSLKHECKFTSVATQVFKCSCGNDGREQHALVPMGLLVVWDALFVVYNYKVRSSWDKPSI